MVTCPIDPDSEGYNWIFGQAAAGVQLDGGASRFRGDKLNPAAAFTVQWTCNQTTYNAMIGFWTGINYGADPFLINLVFESATPLAYIAHIVTGTFQLASQKGLTYVLQATLEVIPGGVPMISSSQLPEKLVTLAGGNMVFDASQGQVFEVTLNADALVNTFINGVVGLTYTWSIKQPVAGNKNFVWPANVKFNDLPSLAANDRSIIQGKCMSDGNVYPISVMTVN